MSLITNDGKLITSASKVLVTSGGLELFAPDIHIAADKEVARFGYANATALGTVVDWSGNGFGFTQGTAANRPTIRTNVINGLPVFRFDGSNDWLSSGKLTLFNSVAGATYVAVFKRSGGAGVTQGLLSALYSVGGAKGIAILPSLTSSQVQATTRRVSGGASVGVSTTIGYDTSFHVCVATVNFLTGLLKFFIDGVFIGAINNTDTGATTDATSPGFILLGCTGTTSSPVNFFNGDIAEVALFSKEMTSEKCYSITEVLNNKYAL